MPRLRQGALPRTGEGTAGRQQRRHRPRVPGPRRARVRRLALLSHHRRLEPEGAGQALVPAGVLQHPRQARRPPRPRRHPRVDPGAEVLPRGAAGLRARPHHRPGPGGRASLRAARGRRDRPGPARARSARALAGPRLAPQLARGRGRRAARLRLRVGAGGRRLRLAGRDRRPGPLPPLRAVDHLPDDPRLRARPPAGPPGLRPLRRPRHRLPARRLPRRRARRLVRLGRGRPHGGRLQAGLRPRLRGPRRLLRDRRRPARCEAAAGRGARCAR